MSHLLKVFVRNENGHHYFLDLSKALKIIRDMIKLMMIMMILVVVMSMIPNIFAMMKIRKNIRDAIMTN
ncbi:hypothetical protein B5C06_08585 [Staphylococcus delphini]|nr:hypothetical protein B5C06_08585 [Staphylococcus delphini]